ncbi:amino acid/amide ABC transporter membrane protein 2, HAAT family /amino acid/amide ABC transporter ATP-binding protein 1, HAAT family [Geodermatophilus pulveris]|uniref:Amino acid/amide ABC transporter membrane protein 2, HAAT family /amino acid/amide ABC transporter ATP-binding protein 1, HAAT family n=1 Tax=Geodermatophilus pulveris TaxID=1564159 RepID=A0A239EA72_9ACTN|nr:ATP-binding cassette domain-containing protein [Geodermatophilus pulveris]SNS41178.1 amino acid/amide ABC transporter membrane protein 2, HAAT family /amino acid/amide ABC transporter ATP-binding protein 1, HAAT family [Geodermatophilus pulveris]
MARRALPLTGAHGRRSRRGDVVGMSVLTVLLVAFPFLAPPSVTNVGVYALIYALAALGLSLLMGLAGQVSLGQAGFFAIGAYTQAVLVTRYETNPVLASVAAVTVTMTVALLVGLPLLRLRGHYLALATLGFGIIVTVLATESEFLGATSGIFGVPKPQFNARTYDSTTEYFLLLVPVVLLGLLLARNVVESRIGRALGAVNDSEVAAESLGVDTFRLRVQVFVLSAAFASVAGTAFAHWLGVINPNAANFPLSVSFLLMAVLGGVGTVYGAVVGAFAVEGLDDGLRRLIPELVPGAVGEVQLIGFGILLTVIMIFLPGGLHQLWTTARRRLSGSDLAAGGAPPDGGPAPAPDDGPLLARESRAPAGTPLLEVQGLTKRFGGVTAVDDLDLTVHAGEIVALIGPNGAGKTTAFNMVSGAVVPTAGTVTVAGTRVEGRKPHVAARAGATRTFQNLQIFGSATVLGNVMVGRHLRSRAGLVGAALVLPARREERAVEASARELLDLLGLGPDADRLAVDLPFGRQRLVEVARALALEPDLLLLDEPMAGLSGAERRDLARLLRRLRAGGMAIVLVEHDVEAVLALADRVAVLEDGVRIALGTPDQVRHDPAVIAAYLGVDPEDSTAVAVAEAGPGEAR